MNELAPKAKPEPINRFGLIDKRLMTLESISAECGALLTKVMVRQHRVREVNFVDVTPRSRNLLSI